MCESIERAVAQRGSDYAVRFECVCVCVGGNVMTLDKNLPFAENLGIIRRIPSGCRGTKHPLFYQTRPSQRLLWLWMELARCAIPHIPAEIPPLFPPHFSITERWQAKKKVHNFCCCYVVLSRTANRSPLLIISVTSTCRRTDFLPLSAGVLIVALHVHAHARRTEINWCNSWRWRPSFSQRIRNFCKIWQMKMSYFYGHYILKLKK